MELNSNQNNSGSAKETIRAVGNELQHIEFALAEIREPFDAGKFLQELQGLSKEEILQRVEEATIRTIANVDTATQSLQSAVRAIELHDDTTEMFKNSPVEPDDKPNYFTVNTPYYVPFSRLSSNGADTYGKIVQHTRTEIKALASLPKTPEKFKKQYVEKVVEHLASVGLHLRDDVPSQDG